VPYACGSGAAYLAALGSMNQEPSRVLRIAIYLGMLCPFFVLGIYVGDLLERYFQAQTSTTFFVIFSLVIASFFTGYAVEKPLLWKHFFDSEPDEIQWIGSRSSILIGTAPPPISLGLVIGMLIKILQ
jgi:hypothetical protein